MVAALVLASVINVADKPPLHRHVRSTDGRIRVLIEKGVARSTTFRHLMDVLDASDVIVYFDPKLSRPLLHGYLNHHMTVAGGIRYIRVMADVTGAETRGIAIIAHELQHAVEVANAPEVLDDRSLALLFERAHLQFGCAGECFETQAAIDVEYTVIAELKAAKGPSTLASSR